MTPKKSVGNTTAKYIEKMPKRTVKKEKPTSTLSSLTVQFAVPTEKSEAGVHTPIIRGRNPPKFKTKLDFQTKVELANSVARQQLLKEEIPPIVMSPIIDNPTPRRGRKKKVNVISDFFHPIVTIVNNSSEHAVNSTATTKLNNNTTIKKQEPTRRIVTRKRLADSTATEPAKRQKIDLKPGAQIANAETKVEEIPNTNNLVEPKTEPDIQDLPDKGPELQDTETQSLLTPKKTKPTSRRPRYMVKIPSLKPPAGLQLKRRTIKGKQGTASNGGLPSILDQLRKLPKKEIGVQDKIQTNKNNAPGAVDSGTASVSSHSNCSWTKDISTSSATTCITAASHDFVRFNKKMPIVKIRNIANEIKDIQLQRDAQESADLNESDSSSDSSNSDCTDCSKQNFSGHVNDAIEINSLHLSTSSAPSTNTQSLQKHSKDSSHDFVKAAERLSLSLNKIDMEIINWISPDSQDIDTNIEKFKNNVLDVLDMEFAVITHCRNLKKIYDPSIVDDLQEENCALQPTKDNNCGENAPVVEVANDDNFVKPKPYRKLSNISGGNISNVSNTDAGEESSEDDLPAGDARNYQYYDHHDDDDTLSLFAESITGIESSRMTSIASAPIHNIHTVEEYVPHPVKEDFPPNTEKHTYCPTKIKNICEKQNADSTSIYKQSDSMGDAESSQDFNEHIDLDTRISPTDIIKRPRLMETLYEVQPKARSMVFGNLCFYNLMNCCRKIYYGQCRFLHIIPTGAQIKKKLEFLDERMLIKEYLLLRNWSELRRRYGMCYVEECAKRGLTRVLVEMAYDFIVKAKKDIEEDTRLRINTIEVTLLHLNSVDLSVCEDLLRLTIHSDQTTTMLCDVFMATMSITQNFTRFKVVFLNLTYFMVDNDRTFNKDVVEHILERVCILPFEEPMARALIQMMRLTKSEIFNNSMIGFFEKQISVNKDVFEEYSMLKSRCALTSLLACSVLESSADPPAGPPPPDGEPQPPAASPDTTNLDNMNKTTEESSTPVITRTIGMNPPITFSRAPLSLTAKALESSGPSRAYNSSGSPNTDDTGPHIRKWRNRAIFPHLQPPPVSVDRPMNRAPARSPLRAPNWPHTRPPLRNPFNERLVTFRSPAVCIPNFILPATL